jgi:hypothetical protein
VLSLLLFRLDDVEDGGADQQVGECGDDEAEGSYVLLLHSWDVTQVVTSYE